jgi:hypothetical protein
MKKKIVKKVKKVNKVKEDIENETDLLILDNWQIGYYGNIKMDWMILK